MEYRVNKYSPELDESHKGDVVSSESGLAGKAERIVSLLKEAAETHHIVYRIVDGNDADWASWYADWLINLSELPDLLGARPVRSQLVYELVDLDRRYNQEKPDRAWEAFYAARLLERFSPARAEGSEPAF
jgi:hypothetical protein